jgi:peroxiredoxin
MAQTSEKHGRSRLVRALLPLTAAAALLAGCAGRDRVPGVDIGDQAPELTGDTVTGEPVKLSQHHGKVVLVDFWATWCGYCVKELPEERDLHRQFDTRPFVILGVSQDRSVDELKRFLTREKLPWPQIHDARGNVSDQWKIDGLPTFVLVDHKGVIVGRWSGSGNMEAIRQAVESAVKAAEGS